MREPDVWVGIDVSTVPLDVALRPPDDRGPVSHDEPGMTLLIVLAAPGGLEVPGAGAWAEAGLPVVVVNPRHARDFATATGQLAKTDPLAAPGLAPLVEAVRPPPRPLPAAPAHAWSALLPRRRPLVQRLTAARRRRQRAPQRIRGPKCRNWAC